MPVIFTVNDTLTQSKTTIRAELIANALGSRLLWAASTYAPNRHQLEKGAKVLFYLCGPGRRCFCGSGVLASSLHPANRDEQELLTSLGLYHMSDCLDLERFVLFEPTIPIRPLIPQLSFIRDKHNYGLNLRLPIIRISESDFALIQSLGGHASEFGS